MVVVVVTSLSGTLAVRFRDEARSQVSLDFFFNIQKSVQLTRFLYDYCGNCSRIS